MICTYVKIHGGNENEIENKNENKCTNMTQTNQTKNDFDGRKMIVATADAGTRWFNIKSYHVHFSPIEYYEEFDTVRVSAKCMYEQLRKQTMCVNFHKLNDERMRAC